MTEAIRYLAAKPTPVPDINTQVVSELKDVVGEAKDKTTEIDVTDDFSEITVDDVDL